MSDVECGCGDAADCDCDCGDIDCNCDYCGNMDCGCDCHLCDAFNCGNLCLGDSNNNIIFCCFPGPSSSASRPNRTNTSPDISLCCCCFPGESSYPSTSQPSRISPQDKKHESFCSRVRKFFSRKRTSDQSMPSNLPPGKIHGVPHHSGDYPVDERSNPHPFPPEKYPMHGLHPPTSIYEVPARNRPMDSVYPPMKIPEFSRNPMEGHHPPAKMPEVPPRSYPLEREYPPTKREELPASKIRLVSGYGPVKEALGGDAEEKGRDQEERTAHEELDMPARDHMFQGSWSKHTMYEDRERRSGWNL